VRIPGRRSSLLVVFLLAAIGCTTPAERAATPVTVSERLLALFPPDADPAAVDARAGEQGLRTDSHGVVVDVQTQGLTAADRAKFDLPGVVIRHFSAAYERVSASVRDRQALMALAGLEPVRRIQPAYGTAPRGRDVDSD